MKTITNHKDLLLPGDTFEMYLDDWKRIVCPFIIQAPHPQSRSKVKILVKRIYLRSCYEIVYVCQRVEQKRRLNDFDNNEFAISQLLVDLYEVTVKSETYPVSITVIREAAARVGAKEIGGMSMAYTKEDAQKVANEIQKLELHERYGIIGLKNKTVLNQ